MTGQYAHLLRLDLENFRDGALRAEHALARHMQGEAPARRVMHANCRARLHGAYDHATVDEIEPGDVGCAGKGGSHRLRVPIVIIQRDVSGCFVMQERRPRCDRLTRAHHRRQRIDLDLDRLGCVLRLKQRLGNHECDGIADEAYLVRRQRRPRRALHGRAVAIVERNDAFERAVGGKVGAGEGSEHARQTARGRGIDAFDDAVGDAAAHDHRVGLARESHVIGVASGSPHQYRILGPPHRLADGELQHGEAMGIVLQIHETSAVMPREGGASR